jgi:hypothetical protein
VLAKNTTIRIYMTLILHAVLYGCETFFFYNLREEQVAEENALIKSYEVRRGCRKLHNEKLPNLRCLAFIMRMIASRMA